MFDTVDFQRRRRGAFGREFYYFEDLDSTSKTAEQLAKEGAAEGTIVLANGQTQGIGRNGNTWYSPSDVNLYFSIVLRPDASRLHYLPFVTALGVMNTLERIGIASDLKWPNDVLVNGKKISGILMHTSMEENKLQFAVVGCGINVNATEFPEILRETATSILLEAGSIHSREALLASFLLEFETLYGRIEDASWNDFCAQVEKRSSFLRGRCVKIQQQGAAFEGITSGLDPYGGLILKIGRETRIFYAGEVQLCRKR